MENIMMLPASYCVMNEEEMTYTAGGVGHLIVRKHCVISRQFHIFLHKESLLHISRRRTALQRSLLQSKHL